MSRSEMFLLFGITWLLLLLLALMVIRTVRLQNVLLAEWARPRTLPLNIIAPSFSVATSTGGKLGLEDFAGRPLLMVFASASCAGCRKKMPELVHLSRQLKELEVEMLLFGMDSPVSMQNMVREFGIVSPVLFAPRKVIRRFNPREVTPFYCYLGADHSVVSTGEIGHPDWQELEAFWLKALKEKQHAAILRFM